MEEKEKYELKYVDNGFDLCEEFVPAVVDTTKNRYSEEYTEIVDELNQQYKRIKELEEDQALLTMLISGIDNLMHDKDYRFKNDNGTWYSRQSCKDLTNEEVYQEIIDEINQLDSNFEILDKENQQLKQQLSESETQLKEEIEEKNGVRRALTACNRQNDEFADMIKKLVNEEEELKQQLEEKDKDIKYFKESYYMIQDEKDHYAGQCLNLQDRIEELEKNNKRIRKNKDQDKISFAIDELEKVKETTECVLDNALKNSSLNQSYYDRLLDEIDNQINVLRNNKDES